VSGLDLVHSEVVSEEEVGEVCTKVERNSYVRSEEILFVPCKQMDRMVQMLLDTYC
jgi:hypothetical protein